MEGTNPAFLTSTVEFSVWLSAVVLVALAAEVKAKIGIQIQPLTLNCSAKATRRGPRKGLRSELEKE